MNPVVAARMIEKNPLFHRPRPHLPILAQMNRRLREPIRLAARIQPKHVRLPLRRPRVRIQNRRQNEEQNPRQQKNQRQHRRIGNPANTPPLAPLGQRPRQRPAQVGKAPHNHQEEKQRVFGNVVQHIVPHLVTHHRLNLFPRPTPQQIVVQRNPHCPRKPTHIRAHPRRLTARVNLIHIVRRYAVRMSHAQNRHRHLWIVQTGHLVEDRLQVNRANHHQHHHECNGCKGAPNPPGPRQLAHNQKQHRSRHEAQHHRHQQPLAFIPHPWPKRLCRHAVFVLPNIVLVKLQRKPQHRRHHRILQPIDRRLQPHPPADARRQIAHPRRPAQVQQQERHRRGI